LLFALDKTAIIDVRLVWGRRKWLWEDLLELDELGRRGKASKEMILAKRRREINMFPYFS
jgi:hypothetical protein